MWPFDRYVYIILFYSDKAPGFIGAYSSLGSALRKIRDWATPEFKVVKTRGTVWYIKEKEVGIRYSIVKEKVHG